MAIHSPTVPLLMDSLRRDWLIPVGRESMNTFGAVTLRNLGSGAGEFTHAWTQYPETTEKSMCGLPHCKSLWLTIASSSVRWMLSLLPAMITRITFEIAQPFLGSRASGVY